MFCSKCGKENADDATFCGGCGAKIGAGVTEQAKASPPQAAPQATSKKRPSLTILIGGGFIGLVIIVIVIGVITKSGPPAPTGTNAASGSNGYLEVTLSKIS